MRFGAVAIGRNEGDRLLRSLASLTAASAVIYVDSGSSDRSVERASNQGVDVLELDRSLPFTAARARNVGFRRLRQTNPDLAYIQFIDADCEMFSHWPTQAISFLEKNEKVAAVCGRLRERHPERSIYNWLCDREWDAAAGEVQACGGIMLMRAAAFEAVEGFRDDLIAGEEPELCVRLRAAGWRIWRPECDMALHDAAMTHFGQWWRRSLRSGYAFAQGAYLHGAAPERHKVWESRRAWLWGILLPVTLLAISLAFPPWGWLVWAVYPVQIIRLTLRNSGTLSERATYSLFQVLSRFPEAAGQLAFLRDRLLHRRPALIEYK